MAMNSREKMLTAGIGALALLFVGRSIVLSIQEGFEKKADEITKLTQKKGEQELEITAGQVASQKLNAIAPKSLPRSEEQATADYSKWLISLGEQAQLSQPKQDYAGESIEKDGSLHLYKFKLYGVGTIENATELLYGFYAKDYIHRITRFELTPIASSSIPNEMNIMLDCEVLSLRVAKEKQEPPKGISNRITKSLDEYKQTILARNLFAPTNQPPKVDAKKNVEAKVGIRLEHTIEAKEVDPNQRLFYEIVGDGPKGLQIDKETGKLTFLSNELSEHKVSVQVTDNGIPKKSAMQSLTINVKPLPPTPVPPVQFDVASQAVVTALVTGRSSPPEAWILSKTENKTYKLQKGDQLKLGGVTGTVKEVGANYIEMETAGRTWLVGFDETLADAYSRTKVD